MFWHRTCCSPGVVLGSIYQLASSLNGLEKWQETTACNIAASGAPGHKADRVGFETQHVGRAQNGGEDAFSQMLAEVPEPMHKVDMSDGALMRTGITTDFALQGSGFFKLKGPNGEISYTRNGQFHFNAAGVLSNASGWEVQGTSGPLVASPRGGDIKVNRYGDLQQGRQSIGRLAVCDIDPEKIIRTDNGFMLADGGGENMNVSPKLINGFLESSNSSSIHEMTEMIKIARAHELTQHVITQLDTQQSQATNSLGSSRG